MSQAEAVRENLMEKDVELGLGGKWDLGLRRCVSR